MPTTPYPHHVCGRNETDCRQDLSECPLAGAVPACRSRLWTTRKSVDMGAFEPHSGQALTWCADRRTSANFVAFLNQIITTWVEDELVLSGDNLSTHKTLDVLLWARVHPRVRFLFQPTYAPWLNLIEPWWKTLRSLGLKGRCFLKTSEMVQTIQAATDYWNQHRPPYHWRQAA
jgi:transposase